MPCLAGVGIVLFVVSASCSSWSVVRALHDVLSVLISVLSMLVSVCCPCSSTCAARALCIVLSVLFMGAVHALRGVFKKTAELSFHALWSENWARKPAFSASF